jgi:hypothetical protein
MDSSFFLSPRRKRPPHGRAQTHLAALADYFRAADAARRRRLAA